MQSLMGETPKTALHRLAKGAGSREQGAGERGRIQKILLVK
ncbi:hypothetical protein [Moorena producens]|nr:hypothetical protein [Moorena producens]